MSCHSLESIVIYLLMLDTYKNLQLVGSQIQTLDIYERYLKHFLNLSIAIYATVNNNAHTYIL